MEPGVYRVQFEENVRIEVLSRDGRCMPSEKYWLYVQPCLQYRNFHRTEIFRFFGGAIVKGKSDGLLGTKIRLNIVKVGDIFDTHKFCCIMVGDTTKIPSLQHETGIVVTYTGAVATPVISGAPMGFVLLFELNKLSPFHLPVVAGLDVP